MASSLVQFSENFADAVEHAGASVIALTTRYWGWSSGWFSSFAEISAKYGAGC